MSYRLSADIGGTFTDLVLVDEAGNMDVHKTPSTPRDFTRGILTGAEEIVSGRLGDGNLAPVDTFVHGATVVLNALLQLKLPEPASSRPLGSGTCWRSCGRTTR